MKTVKDAVKEFSSVFPEETDGNNWWLDNDKLSYSLAMTVNLVCTREEFEDYVKQQENKHDKNTAAIATLENLGYEHNGGELWKPPLKAKPVYTQEKADNGELPPIDSYIDISRNSNGANVARSALVKYSSKYHCIVSVDSDELSFQPREYHYKPADTRTDKEKLIDKAKELCKNLDKEDFDNLFNVYLK